MDDKKPIQEEEVESWISTLTEASYDRKDKIDPPAKELIGTDNERFYVTALEIRQGIKLVRRASAIANLPSKFTGIAPTLAPCFDKSKTLYAMMMSLEFAIKSMAYYSETKLAREKENFLDAQEKFTKLIRFVNTLRDQLTTMRTSMGEADIQEQLERMNDRQTTRQHDSPTRPAQSRKDPTRKSFSLADTLDSD